MAKQTREKMERAQAGPKPRKARAGSAKREIRDKALALGFDAVGFAAPAQSATAQANLGEYLARGYHGDMGWLAANTDRRADPAVLWPEARSVVALGLSYAPGEDPLGLLAHRDRGSISVYARGRDYHDVLKTRMKALGRWMAEAHDCQVKVFVDTAPVMEKPLAERAGAGWQGKHSNLVSRQFGSWLFLGEVFTSLALAPDSPESDHCGSCTRCLDICPTDAFPAPYRLDARRCISYLTIEYKGHIDRRFRAAMGNRIYGCDDCLAVCPWNKFAVPHRTKALLPRAELSAPRLADLAALDDSAFRKVFAGSPIKRTGRDRFLRNVLIAIGNCGEAGLADVARRLLSDSSPLVRAMAVWALAQLATESDFARERARFLEQETDAAVRAEWMGDP